MRKGIVKVAQILILSAAVLFTLVLTFDSLMLDRTGEYIFTPEQKAALPQADVILVLGARVYSSGTLSPVLSDRASLGVELYKAGLAPKLLFSGDHGQKEYDEVNAMRAFAQELGVPAEDIFLDHAGFSTYESMYRAKEVFGVRSAIIVTQRFHLPRAVYLARGFGIEAFGVNADPRRYAHEKVNYAREFFAQTKDYLYINVFRPLPKYLGERIDITGDGRVTHE